MIAEGGRETDNALADLWWRRLHAGEPTPVAAPALQIMGTPTKLRAVYHAVVEEAARLGIAASAHISRFDPDGGLVFFTLGAEPHMIDVARIEQVAEAAGGWLLGARADEARRLPPGVARGARSARNHEPRHARLADHCGNPRAATPAMNLPAAATKSYTPAMY